MAFNKADRLRAKELLATTIDTKSYKAPKRRRRKTGKKPGPKPKVKLAAPMKLGPFTDEEKIAVETLVKTISPDTPPAIERAQTEALSVALRRTPEAIRNNVISARERIQADAETYAGLNMVAARVAAAAGDGRPAQWALERISAQDEKGKKMRVVDNPKGEGERSTMPTVNIGVMLGGIAPGASLTNLPTITVETIEDDNEP